MGGGGIFAPHARRSGALNAGMRISVSHTTVFRYDNPVVLEPHLIRLRPRDDAAQRLLRHDLEITPRPAGSAWLLDQDGNVVLQAWFTGPTQVLSVFSSFDVETLRENPYDFLLPLPPELTLPASAPAELGPYLAGGADAPVREFAESLSIQSDRQTMPFVKALAKLLFDEWRQVVRPEGAPMTALETLKSREGSCRDLTVLFCACCRAVGLASRFVSGYERESAFGDHAYMHAWAEVFIPGGGWRGFDPSRGLAVSTSHVAVAAAADPAMAAPTTGTYRGAARSGMEFQIQMQTG
jgi:transglutaminase-like putative cysteine protease